jgi:hypothetical protein
VSLTAKAVFEQLNMLSKGSGLFRVDATSRSAKERAVLERHRWRARLEWHLRRAHDHGADWVYFRLECDAGGPKPEIFVYDRIAGSLAAGGTAAETARFHHELWNYGKVPLAFFLRPTSVEVINLLEPPAFEQVGETYELAPRKPLAELALSAADTLAAAGAAAKGIGRREGEWSRFCALYFDNGTFWEMPANQGLGRAEQSSVASMVEEMRAVRRRVEKSFLTRTDLTDRDARAFVRRMLIITLMVRFMEERGILPAKYFAAQEHLGATDFSSLLPHRTPLLRALDRLATDFNGDVFTLEDQAEPGDVPIRKILRDLPDGAMQPIADFAAGRMEGGQQLFWQRYSFRHLPVEAISYVYEDFLGGDNQAYFTPHHLVDLLLDESMTPERVREAFKLRDPRDAQSPPAFPVLDPSCGSGVFLVGAWRRLVEVLHLLDASPSPETLKRVMEQNIYGVDIARDSVELTIFSLCVAMSSALPAKPGEPDYIFRTLQTLKFPNLKAALANGRRGNVIESDFFTARPGLLKSPLRFLLVIGNPPFESKLRGAAQESLDSKATDEDEKPWQPVPDDNVSYLFLRAVPPLLANGGVACLVQPAGLVYNEKAAAFRKALLTNWHVSEVLDFASLSGLFTTRKQSTRTDSDSETKVGVKTVAVLIEHRPPDDAAPLLHATFRRTMGLGQREVFEIDPQDLHWIPRRIATNEPRVWKADLLGGGRLLETYKSLTADGTLKQRIGALKAKGWLCAEGFIAADVNSYGDTAEGAKKRYKPEHRPHYADMPMLETDGLSKAGIDSSAIRRCGLEWFLWPRDERLFEPPHLLVKEHESLPSWLRIDGGALLFGHEIVAFKAPPEEVDELTKLSRLIDSFREHFMFFAAFGSRYLTSRQSAVLKKDIMDLPYHKGGKLSFRGVDRHLRDDVVEFMIPLIKDNDHTRADLARAAGQAEVESFARVFLEVMNNAFPALRFVAAHDLDNAWCMAFHKGSGPARDFGDPVLLREHLDALISVDKGRALRCWRVVRHFAGNDIYILKPKPRRYWLKSAAVRDADEMFAWAMQQELKKAQPPQPARI